MEHIKRVFPIQFLEGLRYFFFYVCKQNLPRKVEFSLAKGAAAAAVAMHVIIMPTLVEFYGAHNA